MSEESDPPDRLFVITIVYLISVFVNRLIHGVPNFSILVDSDLVNSVIWAPITEELVFRHIWLLPAFYFKNPVLTILLVISSSVYFGMGHIDPLLPTIFGFYMCGLRLHYNSILPCILVHSIHNLIVSV